MFIRGGAELEALKMQTRIVYTWDWRKKSIRTEVLDGRDWKSLENIYLIYLKYVKIVK